MKKTLQYLKKKSYGMYLVTEGYERKTNQELRDMLENTYRHNCNSEKQENKLDRS